MKLRMGDTDVKAPGRAGAASAPPPPAGPPQPASASAAATPRPETSVRPGRRVAGRRCEDRGVVLMGWCPFVVRSGARGQDFLDKCPAVIWVKWRGEVVARPAGPPP